MAQRVLITGGTGFLGRSLARAMCETWDVTLTGRNHKQNMEAARRTEVRVLPMDVARIESVRDAVIEACPDVIVHAAATKFVDLAEHQPLECVDVNVVGSQNVARIAMEQGTKTVVGISTDKASPPIRNTYGLTKALMERMYCSLDGRSATRFTCVRYGNVAWSTGSVLEVWQRMHSSTGVIGSTGPHMRRFFFTVGEAVALVLTALDNIDTVRGGVLARHMKAAKIADLLDTWVGAKGGRWEKIDGRPGERVDEYLIGNMELPYTRELSFDGIRHYLIAFNDAAPQPLSEALSSATTTVLTETEMLTLIDGEPE